MEASSVRVSTGGDSERFFGVRVLTALDLGGALDVVEDVAAWVLVGDDDARFNSA
ncbi:MAG: hypothetical protein AAF726_09580 [Planctomycetota bacterium]